MRENNMKTTSASVTGGGEHSNDLERSIDWKQGLAIASGVPLLSPLGCISSNPYLGFIGTAGLYAKSCLC